MALDMTEQVISEQDAHAAKDSVGVQTKQWRYSGRFANGTAAAAYVNAPPAQQAGEASLTVHDNGTVDVFIFL
jgi:hypothetical protein